MGGSAPDDSAEQEQQQELQREKEQKVREAELQRIQLLKRAQGFSGGLGNIFSGVNDRLG